MVPYAEVKKHEEINLTLLCDVHHKEVTVGLLTPEQVSKANISPYNVRKGVSSPFALHFSGTAINVEIGSNSLLGGVAHPDGGIAFIPVSVDDNDIFSFRVDEEGKIFFNMFILDECNLPLLVIQDNALMYKTDIWDIAFKGTNLTLRQSSRDIFLDIQFCPPDKIRIIRGRLLCNGVEIIVQKNYLLIVNNGVVLSGMTFKSGGEIGLQLGKNERQYRSMLTTSSSTLKRYGVDRDGAMRTAKKAMDQFTPKRKKRT